VALTAHTFGGDAIEIASGSVPNQPQQPQIASDGSGSVHVVYGAGDQVLYARLAEGANRFTEPSVLPSSGVIALGMRRGPRLALAGKSICISVIGGSQGRGRDGDVLAYHSTDQGKSWNGPIHVNDTPGSAREGLHAMAACPNGQLCCAWLDLRSKKTEIYSATSDDGGATWLKNVLVYRSPDGSVCECCHPSVTFDAKGKLYVMWRNSLAGARDMYLASSTDAGKTFSTAVKLGAGTWPLNACPMDGGFLAVSPNGTVSTAWRRSTQIYVAPIDGQEMLLGTGRQPWIAANSAGSYVLWVTQKNGKLLMSGPRTKQPTELAANANDPVIVPAANKDGQMIAAWEERHGEKSVLICKVIEQ
jgi:hypothetical protein